MAGQSKTTKPTKRRVGEDDPNVYFMIRHKTTGCFSSGYAPSIRWKKKKGKEWTTRQGLMRHLAMVQKSMEYRLASVAQGRGFVPVVDPYRDAEVVQFRKTEEGCMDVQGYGE